MGSQQAVVPAILHTQLPSSSLEPIRAEWLGCIAPYTATANVAENRHTDRSARIVPNSEAPRDGEFITPLNGFR